MSCFLHPESFFLPFGLRRAGERNIFTIAISLSLSFGACRIDWARNLCRCQSDKWQFFIFPLNFSSTIHSSSSSFYFLVSLWFQIDFEVGSSFHYLSNSEAILLLGSVPS